MKLLLYAMIRKVGEGFKETEYRTQNTGDRRKNRELIEAMERSN